MTEAKKAEVTVEKRKGNGFAYYAAKVTDSNGECRFSLPRGAYRVKAVKKKKYSKPKELEVFKDMEETIIIYDDSEKKKMEKKIKKGNLLQLRGLGH